MAKRLFFSLTKITPRERAGVAMTGSDQSPRTCTATSSSPNPMIHDHCASWLSTLMTPNVASRATA